MWSALVNARIRIAELLGDTALAARLADRRLGTEKDGKIAAALAMRVAEQAASEGDATRALEALSQATTSDPGCIPARALQLDILADAGDAAFAAQLEAMADHFESNEAKGRAYVLAAFVAASRASDVESAKSSLANAGVCGVAPGILARLGRSLASICGDAAWYEESTRRLVGNGASEGEVPLLLFELARIRFARGDAEGAHKALRDLSSDPQGAWLGRTLGAFLPTEAGAVRDGRAAVEELATVAQDGDVAQALSFIGAVRAHADGDLDTARDRMRKLLALDPADPLATTFLVRLHRDAGARSEAADALVACASASAGTDAELAAAFYLEAGCERWAGGDRAGAIAAFDAAQEAAPAAAKTALAWAWRGVDVDSPDGRRHAMAHALEGGADSRVVALERFALEAMGGDVDAAGASLARVERDTDGPFAAAATLARVVWKAGERDDEAVRDALDRLAGSGEEAARFAAAERLRLARESGATDLADAARRWVDVGGGAPATLEWIAAAVAGGDLDAEVAARRALGQTIEGAAAREAILASAAMLSAVTQPDRSQPLVGGDGPAAKLVNLEISLPGCDPRRRHAALVGLGTALGDDAATDATGLAGWSLLVSGRADEALEAFRDVTFVRPDDLHAWEGMRTAAEAVGNKEAMAVAAEQLGARCTDDVRGAIFWEQAAGLWIALGNAIRGEASLDASFERNPNRPTAFDKLFRMVRERKDGDKLLKLIERRLQHTDEPPEISKLFWEQARVLREKGDSDAALKALENVTMLEPDHVGALALTGEIFIRRGMYQEAAANLARLAKIEDAPAKNRATAGVAAVDLYENKLNRPELALEVLLALHRAKLSTLPVRERLARAAARTGAWREATSILEELMNERPEVEGRVEAARLAMAIYRDRLGEPQGAVSAVLKLLSESPGDGEALDMLIALQADPMTKERLLRHGREVTLQMLQNAPADLPGVRRVGHISRMLMEEGMQQAALSVALALGGPDGQTEQTLGQLLAKKARVPQIALTEPIFRHILAPGDDGPLAQLFVLLGPTLAEALGPSIAALGVTKKDKVDPRSGLGLRNEVAAWAGAFGIHEFDFYVGGKDPVAVQGIPGEVPAVVMGPQVGSPLNPMTRARVARELLAIVRGTTVTRWRDDTTIAAIVVAACNIADVRVDSPPYAMLAEIEKLVGRAIARKTKKLLPEICRSIVASGADARAWAHRALASHNRVAVVAAGDVSVVLADLLGAAPQITDVARHDARAHELFRFVLSPAYLEIRRALGLEGTS
jgi:tetratricopeptide (TPR) repeat protein